MFQCVKLILKIFDFRVLLFDCFVYRQNVTCLKRFTKYGHYVGKMEDIGRLTQLFVKSVCQKLEHLVAV